MKLKHLIANKPKASVNDREKMRAIEDQLQEIRLKGFVDDIHAFLFSPLIECSLVQPKV